MPSSARVAGDNRSRTSDATPPPLPPLRPLDTPPLLLLYGLGAATPTGRDPLPLPPRDAPAAGVLGPLPPLPLAAPRAWMLAIKASRCAMLRRMSSSWTRPLGAADAAWCGGGADDDGAVARPGWPYLDAAAPGLGAAAPEVTAGPRPRGVAMPRGVTPPLPPALGMPRPLRTLGGGDARRVAAALLLGASL